MKEILKIRAIIYLVGVSLFVVSLVRCSYSESENFDDDKSIFNSTKNTNAKQIQLLNLLSDSTYIEREFARSLTLDNSSIKLIGFKTIYIGDDEIDQLNKLIEENVEKFTNKKNYFYSKEGKYLRVYFPLHTAIIDFNGKEYEANEFGIVSNLEPQNNNVALSIKGRKKSDMVKGTGSNRIVGNQIILKQSLLFDHLYTTDNIYVFNLGERGFSKEMGHSCCSQSSKSRNATKSTLDTLHLSSRLSSINEGGKEGENNVSCYQNHGNRNCTTAFGNSQGGCTFYPGICMDYNGWFTNCTNGVLLNFPGSDCDYAMGSGHCWNEIM